jgi:hypothetical protein
LAETKEEIIAITLEAALESTPFQRGLLSLFDKPVDPDNPGTVHVEKYGHRGLSESEIKELEETDLDELEVNTDKFDEHFQLGKSFYVPYEERRERFEDGATVSSKLLAEQTLDWHPDDSLYIPLYREEKIVGQISVDDPEDGLVPEPEDLQPIENFALLASLGLEKLELARERQK